MAHHDTLFRELIDHANRHDADAIQPYLADDMTFENPLTGPTDKRGMYGFHGSMWSSFPDLTYHLTNLVTTADTVVAECTVKGTHQAEMMGIPATHKHLTLQAAFVAQFKEGKIRRWTSYFDTGTMMRQLGLTK